MTDIVILDAVEALAAKVRDNVIVTRETHYFAQSGTFVAPADGIAIFRVLGAGGSGASSGQSKPVRAARFASFSARVRAGRASATPSRAEAVGFSACLISSNTVSISFLIL